MASGPRRLRPWLLAALALSILVVGTQQLWLRRGEPVFPDAGGADAVHRIELARGRDQVVLGRRADTGAWAVLSAADAPGNGPRIEATLTALLALRGGAAPVADGEAVEPMEIRLSAADGTVLGHAKLRPGGAERVSDGMRIAVERFPALPLWQSAWADLEPPRIATGDIVAAHRIGPDGRSSLTAAETATIAAMLERLSDDGFVAAASTSWAGARMVQLTLADGSLVDVQQVPKDKSLYLVRMTSDKRPDIRVAREWAFQTTRPLP